MTFLAFRPFRQILKWKSKDITSKTLHAKFYASRIKNKRIRRGVKYAPPRVWSVFKSPGKIGLNMRWRYTFDLYTSDIQSFQNSLRLRLHGAIYRPDSFVPMLRYCANLKAIRNESSLNRIIASKSHCVVVAKLTPVSISS